MEKKTIVARAKVLAEKQAAFLNATEALIQRIRPISFFMKSIRMKMP